MSGQTCISSVEKVNFVIRNEFQPFYSKLFFLSDKYVCCSEQKIFFFCYIQRLFTYTVGLRKAIVNYEFVFCMPTLQEFAVEFLVSILPRFSIERLEYTLYSDSSTKLVEADRQLRELFSSASSESNKIAHYFNVLWRAAGNSSTIGQPSPTACHRGFYINFRKIVYFSY